MRKGKPIVAVTVGPSKLDLFIEEFVNKGGKGTEAALKVFDVKSRATAAVMASQYLKKAQAANMLLFEKKGIDYGALLNEAIVKMHASKTPEWWDRIMKLSGYEDFLSKGPVTKQTVNIMKVQKDLLEDYVEGEYVEDLQ